MNLWGILGIGPTGEISQIKKAYAKQLKVHHPEDDPEGFQLLREAYDSALKYAKYKQSFEIENDILKEDANESPQNTGIHSLSIENIYDESTEEVYYKPKVKFDSNNNDAINTTLNTERLLDEFFRKVHDLYSDFFSRLVEERWEEILNTEIMWNLDSKEVISRRMLEFLKEHSHLPQNIWKLFNTNFHWDEQESYLNSLYQEDFVKYILKQISGHRVPRYCYFNKDNKVDFDEYLNYREEAFIALSYVKLDNVEKCLYQAYRIFQEDPDLICMEADYYIKRKNVKKANKLFKKAIEINTNDVNIIFFQAQILYNNDMFSECIKTCKLLLLYTNKTSEVMEAYCMLGKCYMQLGKWYKASRVLLKNLKINRSDSETIRCLKQLANKLESHLESDVFNFILRNELNKIYVSIGQHGKIERIRITWKAIKFLFTRILIVLVYIFSGLVLIGVTLGGGGAIVLAVVLIQIFKRSKD